MLDDQTILRLLATFAGISPAAEQFVPPRSAGPTTAPLQSKPPEPSASPAPPQPARGPEPSPQRSPPATGDGREAFRQSLALAFRDQMSSQFNRGAAGGGRPMLGRQ